MPRWTGARRAVDVVMRGWDRAAGLVLGVALDAALGDPRRFHPVAGFGRAVGALERRMWADSRARGAAFTGICVGAATALGAATARFATQAAGRQPLVDIGMTAIATWTVLGAKSLAAEGGTLHRMLTAGDLDAARARLTHLVSRDPEGLTEAEIARAAVESMAENSSDAIVAPLFWGAVVGVPGLVAYRAINTLDAMVGYRGARYFNFGWSSARLDDLVNLVPARMTALIVAAMSRRPHETLRVISTFARQHPSPNSGWPESAYAGTLGIHLGGANRYGDRVERRPQLGTGPAPTATDIARAARLTRRVTVAAAAVAAALAVAARPRQR